jgi:hypothetical protein
MGGRIMDKDKNVGTTLSAEEILIDTIKELRKIAQDVSYYQVQNKSAEYRLGMVSGLLYATSKLEKAMSNL